jgi:hypothetical protein
VANSETEAKKQRKPRKKVDPNETASQRWERLVRPRAKRLVDTTILLSNLRGTVYEWDHELELELFAQFEQALENLKKEWEIDDPVSEETPVVVSEEVSEEVEEEIEEVRETVPAGELTDSDW